MLTAFLTAVWAVRWPIAVGLAMLAAACIAHRPTTTYGPRALYGPLPAVDAPDDALNDWTYNPLPATDATDAEFDAWWANFMNEESR